LATGRPSHSDRTERAMAATGQKGLYVNMNTGAVQAYLPPFRNALINGDMRVNQRGTSTNLAALTAVATVSPGSWVVDRWNVYRPGFVAGASIGQGTGMVYADLPFSDAGIATHARVGRTAANAATTAIYCDYNMESQDSYRLVGKTVTLSFYYRTGTNFSDNFLTATLHSGTATDAPLRSGTFTSFATTAFAKSSSWVRATVTGTVPTSAAQVCLRFLYTPVGTAGNADHFDVTGVQLELGSVATPFEVRPFSVELQACMRYCETSFPIGIAPGFNKGESAAHWTYLGAWTFGTRFQAAIQMLIKKRSVLYSITLYNPYYTYGQVSASGDGTRVGTVALFRKTQLNFSLDFLDNTGSGANGMGNTFVHTSWVVDDEL
jgi:hypothetical protein